MKVMLDVLPGFVIDMLDRSLMTGPVTHQDHRDFSRVFQSCDWLIQKPTICQSNFS